MSKLNYISIEYKNNYAIIRYEANDDCWNEKLLLEIQKTQLMQQNLLIINFLHILFCFQKSYFIILPME